MKVPREPIPITKVKNFFRALRGLIGTTRLCALPSAAALHVNNPLFKILDRPQKQG